MDPITNARINKLERITSDLCRFVYASPSPENENNIGAEEHISVDEAATHLGIDSHYLLGLKKRGLGPKATRPSPKVLLFKRSDLDEWKRTWEVL